MSDRAPAFLDQAQAFLAAAQALEGTDPMVEMTLLAQAVHMGRAALRHLGRYDDKARAMGREIARVQLRMEVDPTAAPGPKSLTVRRFLIGQFLQRVEQIVADAGPPPKPRPDDDYV